MLYVSDRLRNVRKRAGYESRESCLDQNEGHSINDDFYCGQGANGRYYYNNDPNR